MFINIENNFLVKHKQNFHILKGIFSPLKNREINKLYPELLLDQIRYFLI